MAQGCNPVATFPPTLASGDIFPDYCHRLCENAKRYRDFKQKLEKFSIEKTHPVFSYKDAHTVWSFPVELSWVWTLTFGAKITEVVTTTQDALLFAETHPLPAMSAVKLQMHISNLHLNVGRVGSDERSVGAGSTSSVHWQQSVTVPVTGWRCSILL